MRARSLGSLVATNLRSSPGSAASAVLGVALGAAFLTFFIGLGEGLRSRVLNRILPANQIEVEPRSVRVFGVAGSPTGGDLDPARLRRLQGLPGVERALGKQRSAFPARLWGGRHLIGYDLHTEAFFDGIPDALLRPELEAFERGLDLGRRRRERCDVDDDCPAGSRCDEGVCAAVRWAMRFDSRDVVLRCASDADCQRGDACAEGRCLPRCGEGDPEASPCGAGQRCLPATLASADSAGDADRQGGAPAVCSDRCRSDSDCHGAEVCDAKAGGDGLRQCQAVRCLLQRAEDARSLERTAMRGQLAEACDAPGGLCGRGGACAGHSYCAADAPGALSGRCELPVPVVLNPLLLEVFNTDMAASLGIARVAAPEALLGVRFHLALGDSHFTTDAARERQMVRQAVVVGFSSKAPELGVTAPLAAVAGWNARFSGSAAGSRYDGAIIETASNEAVSATIAEAEAMGLELSRRSRTARTFGTVVLLIYLALVLLALVVLAVSALGIAHTFAILVHERRREIAVLRALGATTRAIFGLVLVEAMLLGAAGGSLGLCLAHLAAMAVEAAASRWLADVPLLPDAFFEVPAWSYVLPIAVGVFFCALGAAWPARRATRLDPATVLSQP